jgi:hypothetical protein
MDTEPTSTHDAGIVHPKRKLESITDENSAAQRRSRVSSEQVADALRTSTDDANGSTEDTSSSSSSSSSSSLVVRVSRSSLASAHLQHLMQPPTPSPIEQSVFSELASDYDHRFKGRALQDQVTKALPSSAWSMAELRAKRFNHYNARFGLSSIDYQSYTMFSTELQQRREAQRHSLLAIDEPMFPDSIVDL